MEQDDTKFRHAPVWWWDCPMCVFTLVVDSRLLDNFIDVRVCVRKALELHAKGHSDDLVASVEDMLQ